MRDSETPIPAPRAALLRRLGYEFADPDQFELSLRHRSWCSENGAVESNERLEFLGDSVLGLVITEHLYRRAPSRSEGTLARNRAEIVSSSALAELARGINLGEALLLGKGEIATGGRDKTSILADALEAVIGAVFIDGGLAAAETVVLRVFGDLLESVLGGDVTTDYKSRLQEICARDFGEPPDYLIDEEGPEHNKRFSATVVIDGIPRGRGDGPTKKAAEQAAARAGLGVLADEADLGPGAGYGPDDNESEATVEESHA